MDRDTGRNEHGFTRSNFARRINAGAKVHPGATRRRVGGQVRADPLVEDSDIDSCVSHWCQRMR